jgi:hypothetical protein
VIKLARSKRLKRRTQHQRLGEMPNRTKLWTELFPISEKKAEILKKVKVKILQKTIFQTKEQKIGEIREQKVQYALQALRDKKKIVSYLRTAKFSFSDLIDGVDFMFIYIDRTYQTCRFSVTGRKWIKEHQKNHPNIPVIAIYLEETKKSIERKILELITSGGS